MIAVSHRFPQLLPLFPTQSQKTIHFKKIHVEKRSDSHSENNTTALHKILVRQKQVDKFLLKNEKRIFQVVHTHMPFLLLIRGYNQHHVIMQFNFLSRQEQIPCSFPEKIEFKKIGLIAFFYIKPTTLFLTVCRAEQKIYSTRSLGIFQQ